MDKKEQIIDKATELFSRQGYDGTSIRQIAQDAGVNLAMINYYFGSKEKLFENVIEYRVNFTKDRLEEINQNSSLDEMEKMEQVVEVYVNRILAYPSFHRILQQEMMVTLRPELQQIVMDILMQNKFIIQRIIEEGIRKKVFKPVDAQLTLATLLGTINYVMLSKSLCTAFFNKGKDFDPYTDTEFRKRIISHLKQILRSHLQNTQ